MIAVPTEAAEDDYARIVADAERPVARASDPSTVPPAMGATAALLVFFGAHHLWFGVALGFMRPSDATAPAWVDGFVIFYFVHGLSAIVSAFLIHRSRRGWHVALGQGIVFLLLGIAGLTIAFGATGAGLAFEDVEPLAGGLWRAAYGVLLVALLAHPNSVRYMRWRRDRA